jgi:hypothetical protein
MLVDELQNLYNDVNGKRKRVILINPDYIIFDKADKRLYYIFDTQWNF